MYSLLISSLIYQFLTVKVLSYELNDKFYICQETENDPLFNINCNSTEITNNYTYKNGFVLSKKKYPIEGLAYVCKVRVALRNDLKFVTENKFVSYLDCTKMVLEKKCGQENMVCTENDKEIDCSYEMPRYNLNELKRIQDECFIKTIKILSESNTTELLGTQCDLTKRYCYTKDSTIVWQKDIFHKCDMELIENVTVSKLTENLLHTNTNLLLKILREHKKCGQSVYETTSGLYISLENSNKTYKWKPPKYKLIDTNIKLMSSDSDYNDYVLHQQLKNEIEYLYCINTLNMVQNFKSNLDKFFIIKIGHKDYTIVYKSSNQVFVPKCEVLDKIEINTNLNEKECYEQIPITFIKNGSVVTGFLSNNNIITFSASRIPCSKIENITYITNNQLYHIFYGPTKFHVNISLTGRPSKFEINLTNIYNISFDIKHNSKIFEIQNFIKDLIDHENKERVDIKNINRNQNLIENQGFFATLYQKIVQNFKKLMAKIYDFFMSLSNIYKFLIIILLTVLAVLITVILVRLGLVILSCLSKCRKRRSRNELNARYIPFVEMVKFEKRQKVNSE
jgi:hypothetical protein